MSTVGPHAPRLGVFDFRFIETGSLIEYMGRIGVLFLLFYLGLEANVTRLIEAGRSILTGGTIYVGINFAVGFTFGYLAGFPLREALIVAGLTTVSSSATVAKILFDYRRMANPETQIVLGITIVGRRAKLSAIGALNTSFTLLARGDPASADRLVELYNTYRRATGGGAPR
jgi:Kef-type K+ transport system membrane component KefB